MRAVALALALASCVDASSEFHCDPGNDAACIDDHGARGHCELSGNCSFPDATCGAPGSRYDRTAQPGRQGICVLSPSAFSATDPQPIDAMHPAEFEITTGTQVIVFDTEQPGTSVPVTLHWFTGTCPPTTLTEAAKSPQSCGDAIVSRITATAASPGPYCVVATDDSGPGGVALRVFPQTAGTAPSCLQ